MEREVAFHLRPANLVLRRSRREVLDLYIAVDGSARNGECATTGNLQVTSYSRVAGEEVSAVQSYVTGDCPADSAGRSGALLAAAAGRGLKCARGGRKVIRLRAAGNVGVA